MVLGSLPPSTSNPWNQIELTSFDGFLFDQRTPKTNALTPLSSQPSSHLNKFRGSERRRNAVETEQPRMCSQSGQHQCCWRITNTIQVQSKTYSTVSYRTPTRQTKRAAKAKIHIRSTICRNGIPLGIKSFEWLFEPSSSLFAACQRQKCRAPNQINHNNPLKFSPKHGPGASFLGGPAPKFRSSLRAESVSSQRSDVQVGR